MSGTNKMIVSMNALKKNSESSLTSALENANENAKKNDIKDGKKAKGSKK